MLKKMATIGLLALMLKLSVSCKKQEFHLDESSKVKLANIPQSSLKHQGDIGLCWSYATVALIESDYLNRTGKEVDLSEEMLGFFRLAHNIKDYVGCNIWAKNDGVKPEDAKCPELDDDGYAGANPVSPNEYYYQFAGDLIGRWGIVPESAWSVKFDPYRNSFTQMLPQIRKDLDKFTQHMIDTGKKEITLDDAYSFLTPKIFPSVPPINSFTFEGKNTNALSFAKETLGIEKTRFRNIRFFKPVDTKLFEKTIGEVLTAIYNKKSVAIAVPLPVDPEWGEREIYKKRFKGLDKPFEIMGGHVMVLVDAKNKGGEYGPITHDLSSFIRDFSKDSTFKVKNSWGDEKNEFGQVVSGGYYDLDFGFILDALESGGSVEFSFYN